MSLNYYYYAKLFWHTIIHGDPEALKLLKFPSQFKGYHIAYPKRCNKSEIRNQLFDGFIGKTYLRFYNIQKTTPIIFDLGASYGLIALALYYQFPDAKMHLFEPNPYAAAYIKQLFSINHLQDKDIIIVPATVGGDTSTSTLFIDRNHFESANTICNYSEHYKKHRVPNIKLSTYIRNHDISKIDFLKMDIEGAEWIVINDLYENKLLSMIKNIAMELHIFYTKPTLTTIDVIKMLKESGFLVRIKATGQDRFQKRFLLWAHRKH